MPDSPFVPIEEIVAALNEAGEYATTRTVYNDITAGRIPGEFRGNRHNRKARVKRHQWNQYLRGEDWKQPERQPVGIVSIDRRAS